MRKVACLFLLLAGLIAGCSDSNPAAPPPLEKTDLVADWQGTSSTLVLDWDKYSSTAVHQSLNNVQFHLTIEDASYNLTAECYMASLTYNCQQWGFWEITDAAAGTVSFHANDEQKVLVQNFPDRTVTQTQGMQGVGGRTWNCSAAVAGATLILKDIPPLFDLETDSLNLSRVASSL